MPSTRLMPVVMMSSLQVWSRLARDILFRPMSVQYTVSFPAKYTIQLMMKENGMTNAAATKVFITFKQSSSWNHILLQLCPFHQMLCGTIKYDGENPHTSATALCWHTVFEQERLPLAKFYRAVYYFRENMALVKLLWIFCDFSALLHKDMKLHMIYLWCSLCAACQFG